MTYSDLLKRNETTLINVRGIAYRNHKVLGLHVRFGPGAPYPDRFLEDGNIIHIGEGDGNIQDSTKGGNAGMIAAAADGSHIPVFQYVAENRYAPMGDYKVTTWTRHNLQIKPERQTDALLFTLRPAYVPSTGGLSSDAEVIELARDAAIDDSLLTMEGKRALRTHLARERSPANRDLVIRRKESNVRLVTSCSVHDTAPILPASSKSITFAHLHLGHIRPRSTILLYYVRTVTGQLTKVAASIHVLSQS